MVLGTCPSGNIPVLGPLVCSSHDARSLTCSGRSAQPPAHPSHYTQPPLQPVAPLRAKPKFLIRKYATHKYFKHKLFDLTEFTVCNIYGLRHWVAKVCGLRHQSL